MPKTLDAKVSLLRRDDGEVLVGRHPPHAKLSLALLGMAKVG